MLGFRAIGLIFVLAAALGAMPSAAQTVGKPDASVKVPDKTVAATKAFEAGQKAFEAGKTDAAVTALSAAIGSGGVTNAQLAKALFYRGVALRGQKKPGAALSDLNAAVWLRDGLSATDKAVAEDHRQALLREVAAANGTPAAPVPTAALTQAPIAAPPAVETSPSPVAQSTAAPLPEPAASSPTPPAVIPPSEHSGALPWTLPAAPVQASPPPVAADAQPAAAAAPDTIAEPVASIAPVDRATIATVEAEPAPMSKPLPWQMAETEATAPRPEQSSTWAAPTVTASPAPKEAPTAPAAALEPSEPAATNTLQQPVAALSSTPVDALPALPPAIANVPSALADAGKAAGAALTKFFGGAPASPPVNTPLGVAAVAEAPPAIAPIETASVDPGPSVAARAATADAPAALWSSQTTGTAVPVTPVAVAAAEPAPAVDAAPSIAVLPGPYRLQIAAENSREAADQIMARLILQHGQSLRGLQPVVEEPQTAGVLFGSMSAAYRVSIGPYANQIEPGRLCNILKPHDFDCRVVAVAP